MNKQLFGGWLALALSALFTPAGAQDAIRLRDPLARHCAMPVWPPEALRYELQGTTQLAVDLDDAGFPTHVRILRSSGWKLLDDASARAFGQCRFDPPGDPHLRRRDIKRDYNWALTPSSERIRPAAMVADSCAASEHFSGFRALPGGAAIGEGLLVRMLVDAAGAPFGIKFEGDLSDATLEAGLAYLQSCRFTPARGMAGPAPGNLNGRLLPKPVEGS